MLLEFWWMDDLVFFWVVFRCRVWLWRWSSNEGGDNISVSDKVPFPRKEGTVNLCKFWQFLWGCLYHRTSGYISAVYGAQPTSETERFLPWFYKRFMYTSLFWWRIGYVMAINNWCYILWLIPMRFRCIHPFPLYNLYQPTRWIQFIFANFDCQISWWLTDEAANDRYDRLDEVGILVMEGKQHGWDWVGMPLIHSC